MGFLPATHLPVVITSLRETDSVDELLEILDDITEAKGRARVGARRAIMHMLADALIEHEDEVVCDRFALVSCYVENEWLEQQVRDPKLHPLDRIAAKRQQEQVYAALMNFIAVRDGLAEDGGDATAS